MPVHFLPRRSITTAEKGKTALSTTYCKIDAFRTPIQQARSDRENITTYAHCSRQCNLRDGEPQPRASQGYDELARCTQEGQQQREESAHLLYGCSFRCFLESEKLHATSFLAYQQRMPKLADDVAAAGAALLLCRAPAAAATTTPLWRRHCQLHQQHAQRV